MKVFLWSVLNLKGDLKNTLRADLIKMSSGEKIAAPTA